MNRRWSASVLLAVSLAGCGSTTAVKAAVAGQSLVTGDPVTVTRVVDGDTVHVVDAAGLDTTLRLIGLDSPETKKPRTPVQCGGLAATAYAKDALLGKRVQLVADPTQDTVDRYGRRLGYLRLADGTDYSTEAVRAGVARAYTYDKPALEDPAIQAAEAEARAAGRGGWSSCGWS